MIEKRCEVRGQGNQIKRKGRKDVVDLQGGCKEKGRTSERVSVNKRERSEREDGSEKGRERRGRKKRE